MLPNGATVRPVALGHDLVDDGNSASSFEIGCFDGSSLQDGGAESFEVVGVDVAVERLQWLPVVCSAVEAVNVDEGAGGKCVEGQRHCPRCRVNARERCDLLSEVAIELQLTIRV